MQRRSPSKTVGGAKSGLESNLVPTRDTRGTQTNLVHQDPETPQRLSQNCVWASPAEVQVSSGLLQGQGLWVQQTWVWHKPSWRMSPLTHRRAARTYTGLGKQTLGGHKQNLVRTRTQEKGAMAPQGSGRLAHECQESLAEACVSGGLLQGWGHWM